MVNSRVRNHAQSDFVEAAVGVRDNVRDMGTAAKSMAKNKVDLLVKEVGALRDAVLTKVGKQPMKSVLLAAGGGLLLGLLLRRR